MFGVDEVEAHPFDGFLLGGPIPVGAFWVAGHGVAGGREDLGDGALHRYAIAQEGCSARHLCQVDAAVTRAMVLHGSETCADISRLVVSVAAFRRRVAVGLWRRLE